MLHQDHFLDDGSILFPQEINKEEVRFNYFIYLF